ncbi:MAG TPA: sugar MFS transporter [Steroidobacteraceae bacterium]|nr:sugar MFS transporter [Steroidobacteraceae bacterium]
MPQTSAGGGAVDSEVRTLRLFVFALFFMFGGITSLNDVLIPKLKALFTLNYAEVMLVQSAFFAAYLLISIPAAAVVARIGYMRTAALGLLTMTAGCLLFVPASSSGLYITFLGAIFVLASGITIVQVVANPLISMLGRPQTVHSRLTFAQAFNSLGTTIFPYVGSQLILGSLADGGGANLSGSALKLFRSEQTQAVVHTYLGLAVALTLIAALVWLARRKLTETPSEMPTLSHYMSLLKLPRFSYGTLCIFVYVGGEVAIGSLIVNYLMQSSVLGLGSEAAGHHISWYWGGAMVGRFIGSYLLRVFSPGKVLAFAAAAVMALLFISANTTGLVSGYSLLAIGLFNSIMFPTIFALACEGLGPRAAEASGIICVAIVGGAVVPFLTGRTADLTTLKTALIVPAICYAVICGFGMYARRPAAYVQH